MYVTYVCMYLTQKFPFRLVWEIRDATGNPEHSLLWSFKTNWYIVYTDWDLPKTGHPWRELVSYIYCACICVYTHTCALPVSWVKSGLKTLNLGYCGLPVILDHQSKISSSLFAGRKSCPKFVKKNKKPSICEAWQSQVKQKEICLCKCELQTVLHLQQCLRWNCRHKITFV